MPIYCESVSGTFAKALPSGSFLHNVDNWYPDPDLLRVRTRMIDDVLQVLFKEARVQGVAHCAEAHDAIPALRSHQPLVSNTLPKLYLQIRLQIEWNVMKIEMLFSHVQARPSHDYYQGVEY